MKIKKIVKLLPFICLFSVVGCESGSSDTVTIGIIEPLQHRAMDEIVEGFTTTLKQLYKKPVVIKVENAQNDLNLKRAIIARMQAANYSMIVPIGVDATQMTLAMVKDKPVIGLATDMTEQERQRLQPCNVAVVHDEITPVQTLAFIQAAYPQLKHFTLIHSSANKVFPDVEKMGAAAKQAGLQMDHLMVNTLPELYSVAAAISKDTQGIVVLKDSMIVSGIGTLQKAAIARKIPLITSDQGSVEEGAGFALGVPERETGVLGASLAAQILSGRPACQLPIATMKALTVFINQKGLQDEGQRVEGIQKAAAFLGYKVSIIPEV